MLAVLEMQDALTYICNLQFTIQWPTHASDSCVSYQPGGIDFRHKLDLVRGCTHDIVQRLVGSPLYVVKSGQIKQINQTPSKLGKVQLNESQMPCWLSGITVAVPFAHRGIDADAFAALDTVQSCR